MPLVMLAWCIIVIMGIFVYGACLLWTFQKKTQINKKKFALCVMLACVIAWAGAIVHLFPQRGMPKLINIEVSVLQAGIAFILAYGAFKFINYWKAGKLRVLFTSVVLIVLSYYALSEVRYVYSVMKYFDCPAKRNDKEKLAEEDTYKLHDSVSFIPDFWYRYFKYQKLKNCGLN